MAQQSHFWVTLNRIGSSVSKGYLHNYVHNSIVYNIQRVEATQVSTGAMKCYSSLKGREF